MANTYGRQIVIPLTNKSGGSVAAGDVVVVDTSNNDAFTTDTSGGFTGGVGVAQETIASNATGRVLIGGYAALVNVNASVTRGQYGKTHTVAKQATGTASRGAGTFCQWLTGGTTPDALVYPVDLLGSSLTNPMSAVGDIIQGTTAGAPARLAAPATGKVLTGAGATTPLVYSYPPAYEFDYAEATGSVTVTSTNGASPTAVVTGNAVTYDGSTVVLIEAYVSDFLINSATVAREGHLDIYEDGTSIGTIAICQIEASGVTNRFPVYAARRRTPSNASHTYSIGGYKQNAGDTVLANIGAGGAGVTMPGFIRITKV